MIDEKEFLEWLQHPVTQAVRGLCEKKREELRQQWEGGSFTDYSAETTVLVNVGNLGTCKGLAFVSELDYEQFLSEVDDEPKQVGPAPAGSGSVS